jgi:hypothetical protein
MKNALISGIVGLLFMAGGFYAGFQLMPRPKPVPVVVAPPTTMKPPGAAVAMPTAAAISMDTLTRTSQSMMDLNLALADREKRVTEREAKVEQQEEEMAAERAALDSSHEKFKAMFNDFQSRLQLVEASQQEALQKQAEVFDAMGPDQSIELIRTMDDDTVTRLFTVMDTKPLAKLIGAWKTKYPDDAARLLRMLTNTGLVIDKSKIALDDPLQGNSGGNAPAPSPAPAPADDTPNPPAPEEAPAPDAAPPAPAPDAAPTAPTAPDATTPDSTAPPPLAPPPDAPAPSGPGRTNQPATTDAAPDATTPGAISEALDPAKVPVARPASPSDLGVAATDLQPPRAKPVNLITTSN